MIRFFDIILSIVGLLLTLPVLLVVIIAYRHESNPLFFQLRIGQYQRPFTLVKFRTMHLGTASVASHLVNGDAITPVGRLLRRTKLDELPQLWNVLKGEMSLVGPRPCLENQTAVIAAREALDVFRYKPGVTGLSQLNGIDMSMPEKLAQTDNDMLDNLTLKNYFRYIIQTAIGGGQGDAANNR